MISFKNERVFIHGLRDLELHIIFDTWWASMNVGSKCPIAWNHSRHVSSWPFYLHCGIEETSSPGIICIVCHQVLRHPSKHGTSSMGKHLPAKADIAKLNELTESQGTELPRSTVDETALVLLKRQGSPGITIISLQTKFIFNIPLNPYWSKRQTKHSRLAAKDYETSEYQQDTWNRYLMLRFVSACIPWNTISNLELQWSCKAVRTDLVLLSDTTLSNMCPREYALTVDAIEKQLPPQNILSLALDGWRSTTKLALTSVSAYDMDRNWAHQQQL